MTIDNKLLHNFQCVTIIKSLWIYLALKYNEHLLPVMFASFLTTDSLFFLIIIIFYSENLIDIYLNSVFIYLLVTIALIHIYWYIYNLYNLKCTSAVKLIVIYFNSIKVIPYIFSLYTYIFLIKICVIFGEFTCLSRQPLFFSF